jgi:hypothetical protein
MSEEDSRAWERLNELIWSCAISQAIHVSVELDIPEVLNAGPMTADQLADATGADAWTLETVLRALTAFDVLSIDGQQQYTLAPMGRLLLKSAPVPSLGETGEFFKTIYDPLGALIHMIRTGGVAFDHVYGKCFYDHLTESPELAARFYDMMEKNAPYRYAGLSTVFDFSNVSRVVDVGGGEGSLIVQILRDHHHVKGILFDLPVVSDRARARIEAAGVSDRCEIVSGDFRNSVPRGGDLYVLAQILNNWRDEDARRVLANCRTAMDDRARLLILEPVYFTKPLARWRTLVSLGALAQRGGRTRSEAHIRSLLGAEGFRIDNILQLPSNSTCAIQATPLV